MAASLAGAGWWTAQKSAELFMGALASIPRQVHTNAKVLAGLTSALLQGLVNRYNGLVIEDGTLWIVNPSEMWMRNPKFRYAAVDLRSDESYDKSVAFHPSVDLEMILGLDAKLAKDLEKPEGAGEPTSYLPKLLQILFLTPFKSDQVCTRLDFSPASNFTELNLQSVVDLCKKMNEMREVGKEVSTDLKALLLPKKTVATVKERAAGSEGKSEGKSAVVESRKKYSVYHTVRYSSTKVDESKKKETMIEASAKMRFLGYTSSFYLSGDNLTNYKEDEQSSPYYDVAVYRAHYSPPERDEGLYDVRYGEDVRANPQLYESWNGVASSTVVLEKAGIKDPHRFTPAEIADLAFGGPEGILVLQKKYPYHSGKYKTWQGCLSFPNNNVTADLFQKPLPYQGFNFSGNDYYYYASFPSKSKILVQVLRRYGTSHYVSDAYLFVRPSLHGIVTKFKTNKLRAALSPDYFSHLNFQKDSTESSEAAIGSNFSLAVHKMFCHPDPPLCLPSPCEVPSPPSSCVKIVDPPCPSVQSDAFAKLRRYFPESFYKLFCDEVREQAKLECCEGHPANPIGKKHGHFFVPDGKEELRMTVAARERAESTCESFMLGATPQGLELRKKMNYEPLMLISPSFLKKGKKLFKKAVRSIKRAPVVAKKVVRKLKAGEPVRLGRTKYTVAIKKVPLPPPKNLPPAALETHESREETKRMLQEAKLADNAAKEAHKKALEEARRQRKVEKLEAKLEKSRSKLAPAPSAFPPPPVHTEEEVAALHPASEPPPPLPSGEIVEEHNPVGGKQFEGRCFVNKCDQAATVGCAQCKKKHFCSDAHMMKSYCKTGKFCPGPKIQKNQDQEPVGPGFAKTMHEFKHHTLHSGSKTGPVVTNRKQAIAIAYSEMRKAGHADGSGNRSHKRK